MQPDQLGPYRIGQRIGKGGMGAVYEGIDVQSGQPVAVKALSPQLAAADGFRERFDAEIESLKKLQHEGIVRLFGYGEDEGVLFYSMERVTGPSLEEELRNGRRFDWRETLAIAVQICRALKHAHDHGVVHRDIKPANILLTADGKVKLADFGIARLFGATQLTTAGGVLGTADYMSPEQADGRPVTDKCDQYSLGCVMYALLAGRPPFRAKTMPEMLQLQRFAEPEPVTLFAPSTPPQVSKLIEQLLSKEPANRFPNAMVLGRHMEAMILALSRPKQAGEPVPQATTAVNRATLSPPAPPDDPDATLLGESISLITVQTGSEGLYDAPTLSEEEWSRAASQEPAAAPPATTTAPSRPTRFTTVDEEARRAAARADEVHWSHWASLGGLLAALVLLAYGGWRLMRPASADDLYEAITTAVAADRVAGLRDHRYDIEEFVERFPDDERATEIGDLLEELKLRGQATRVRLGARLGDADDTPVSRWYAAAVALEDADPAAATEILARVLQLYGLEPATADGNVDDEALAISRGEREWLRVIALEHNRLRTRLDDAAAAQRPQVEKRLAAADKIAAKDSEKAALIYRGIVGLYAGEPWAEDVVRRASAALEQMAPPAAADAKAP